MYRTDGRLVVSATDLVGFLFCEHLTTLSGRVVAGELVAPERDDPELEVLRERGLAHEAAYLAQLEAEGLSIVRVSDDDGPVPVQQQVTVAALDAGADVVFQGAFWDDADAAAGVTWRGHADFLRRIHDEHQAAAITIERDAEALAEMFAVMGGTVGGDRGSVTLLRGRRNVRERVHEMLAAARHDVLVQTTAAQAEDGRAWAEALATVQARGVRVRVLARDAQRPPDLPAATFAFVVDGHRAFLGHCVPDDGHLTEGSDTGLDVDQEGIVALLAALLEARWQTGAPRAVPVDARTSESRPPTLGA